MKILDIIRGGQVPPLFKERDKFDSLIKVYADESKTYIQDITKFVNTDFCYDYRGGILKEGEYGGICGLRQDRINKPKVIYIFNLRFWDIINDKDKDLKEYMRILPSIIPNPNHNNKSIITQVLIHSDNIVGGGSHGCITVFPTEWKNFISLFEINEKCKINLIRDPRYKFNLDFNELSEG